MRYEAILAALILFADLTGSAQADLYGHPTAAPRFTTADRHVIDRNEILRSIVEVDPWLVRRILDLTEHNHAAARRSADVAMPEGIDPFKNPDLDQAGRSAVHSVEWFDLLKRARDEKESREKGETSRMSGRSAEGSVELIELMKKAKAAKEAGTAK